MEADEHVLQDGEHRRVVRIGATVRRPVHSWSSSVHALLRHLEAVGFPYAPRVRGLDDQGREVLTFVEGESGPAGWGKVVDDVGVVRFAHLLRDYHQAVADFRVPDGAVWFDGSGQPIVGEVICHGDVGPWNVVWRGAEPMALLDWDYAHPAPAVWDVAYALEYIAPFRDDNECLRWLRYDKPPDRRRRLELFAEAYGLRSSAGLVDAVIDVQRAMIDKVRRLAEAGRQPQVTWVANGHLDELAARVAWSRSHRHLLD